MMKNVTNSTIDILSSEQELSKEEEATGNPKLKKSNMLTRCSEGIREKIAEYRIRHRRKIEVCVYASLNIGFVIYFAFATQHFINKGYDYVPFCDDDEYGLLILLFSFIYLIVFYSLVFKPFILSKILKKLKPIGEATIFQYTWLRWIIYFAILAALLIFLIYDAFDKPNRLIGLIGFFVILLFGFVISEHPGQINWRPVILGIIVQFALGLFTIRWEQGRNFFKCTGDKVSTFLNYTTVGASFVYGEQLITTKVFAFQALSVIFFLSFFVKILYYYGIIQKVVLSLGLVLQSIMGTTICESVNSAANIFLGMTEAPILLQPYLHNLTYSETFAVMTAGFASVSGTVLAAYISFGAKPSYLITASVMAAPAALCYSKLVYPETEQSATATAESIQIPEAEESSVLDAASKGASQAVNIVLGITANVIAFVTFVAFLNGVLNWFGVLVGFDNWSLEEAMSYVFMPLSFLIGVPWEECKFVGKLIGIKTIINEFAAYEQLGKMVEDNIISKRSEVIATYAVCGFSNPGSIGIMLSTLSTMIPTKRDAITSMIFKSFISGACVCFMTASIAGVLTAPEENI